MVSSASKPKTWLKDLRATGEHSRQLQQPTPIKLIRSLYLSLFMSSARFSLITFRNPPCLLRLYHGSIIRRRDSSTGSDGKALYDFSSTNVDHINWQDDPGTIRYDPEKYQIRDGVVSNVLEAGVILVQPCSAVSQNVSTVRNSTYSKAQSCSTS